MSLSTFYYALGVAVVIAVALSTFIATLITTRRQGVRDSQNRADSAMDSAIRALQAELSTLKDANHRLEVMVTEYKSKVEMLEEHNKQLKDMVAGRPEWQLLIQTVSKQATTASRIDQLLDQMPADWHARQDEHYQQTADLLEKLSG